LTATAKPVSRFLPTLTEVVQPPMHASVQSTVPDNGAALALALQEAGAQLEQKLHALIPTLVQGQVESLMDILNQEIQVALRAAVEQAIANLPPSSN
jgi:hypothetical protein